LFEELVPNPIEDIAQGVHGLGPVLGVGFGDEASDLVFKLVQSL
jgi:hypothetical protein